MGSGQNSRKDQSKLIVVHVVHVVVVVFVVHVVVGWLVFLFVVAAAVVGH